MDKNSAINIAYVWWANVLSIVITSDRFIICPPSEFIKYFSQNMSNNYQYTQDNSKPLFTGNIFTYLEKYFKENSFTNTAFISEYEDLIIHIEKPLNYLTKKIL
ncbi:MAG: hypothetical protein QNJ64_01640 [Crocosphaera sp.]|nr:hypothetical protein [Crocosphaera sp.]